MSVFFILCASMGALQIAENTKLLYQKGEQLKLDYSFSIIELIWLFVSLWFLFQGGLPLFGILAISVFTAYHVFGWLVGYRAYKLAEECESEAIEIPLWYFKINLVICAAYSSISYLAFTQTHA